MLPRTYDSQNCSVARALEIVGERWTLLVLRDAMLGITRFEDFQARLGISRTVLTARLAQLVEEGLLDRVRYQRRPDRHEYVLTGKGRDLWPALAALAQWGDRYAAPAGPPREFVHDACGTAIRTEVRCPACDLELSPAEVLSGPGPAGTVSGAGRLSEEVREALSQRRALLTAVRSSGAPIGSLGD